uniref:RING-type E3 ubiquitin transferase n=2 Tax=Cacopsylla melanoneura TaxID=428564 RepID=A0A8D8XRK3_9HEMI
MSDQGASSVLWSPAEMENSRYYCHTCEAEFDNVTRRNDEMLCQNCNQGFIEMVEDPEPLDDANPLDTSQDIDDDDRHFLTNILHEAFQRGFGVPIQTAPRDPRLRPRRGPDVHRISATIRSPAPQPLEHILSDLLVGIGAGGFGQEGTSPLFLVGNPGDYAWGREGLDAIVTQLLNQMDGSGPPPLPTDKIKQIPVTQITKAQVDSNLQCSVCWETFSVEEIVSRLPCDHFYHTPCIEPWLQLHGTCPICRQTVHGTGAAAPGEALSGAAAATQQSPLASATAGLDVATFGNLISNVLLGGARLSSDQSNVAPTTATNHDSSNATSFGNLMANVLLGGSRLASDQSGNVATPTTTSSSSSSPGPNTRADSSSSSTGRRLYDMDFD